MEISVVFRNSLMMFGLLILAAGVVLIIFRLLAGRGIVLRLGGMALAAIVVDAELGFVLGQFDLTFAAMVALAGIGIVTTIGVLYAMFRMVVQPIQSLIVVTKRIAQGDLSESTSHDSDDEIGQLAAVLNEAIAYQRNMAEVVGTMAGGDLTVDIVPKSEEDRLGNAFSQMTTNLRQLIGRVTENANIVGVASNQLSAVAEQTGMATNQITFTIQQIAKGTLQQNTSVNQTASSVDQMARAIDGVAKGAQEQALAVSQSSQVTSQMSAAIHQVAANARASASGASSAADTAKSGAGIVEGNLKGMQSIREKVGLSAQKVEEMGKRSDQIGMIVETIDDIASQTNLLALNAAIEAARAGEHGKGFAVVADEVRKLAERTASATKEISQLIEEVQSTVSEAVSAMDESACEVELGVTQAGEAGIALQSILEAVERVNQQVEEISAAAEQMEASSNELVGAMDSVSAIVEENTAATEEMSASSTQVTQAIENIASISEESHAATEEVSASTEEMSAQVEEVTASASSLASMSQTLLDIVAQFKLDVEEVEDDSQDREDAVDELVLGDNGSAEALEGELTADL